MKVLRNYSPYSWDFGIKDSEGKEVVLPAKSAKKPIVEVTDDQYDLALKDAVFVDMIAAKTIRVLDKVPNEFQDVRERLSEAEVKLEEAQTAKSAVDAELIEKNNKIKELEEKLKELEG
jgi:predicted nuclease with TOPRIM domain